MQPHCVSNSNLHYCWRTYAQITINARKCPFWYSQTHLIVLRDTQRDESEENRGNGVPE